MFHTFTLIKLDRDQDDDLEGDTLVHYRQKRIQGILSKSTNNLITQISELKAKAKLQKFGELIEIRGC